MPSYPNSSKLIKSYVIGQFVTPQKTLIIPIAVQSDGEKSVIVPNKHPKAAPVKNEGTISPPLNPAPIVSAVKTIFNRNASGRTLVLVSHQKRERHNQTASCKNAKKRIFEQLMI